jgi:cell division protein FtsN
MLLLGLPVQIQRAEVNGVLVNRVRVGPYGRLDDMNAAREKLAAEKITANVVRQ